MQRSDWQIDRLQYSHHLAQTASNIAIQISDYSPSTKAIAVRPEDMADKFHSHDVPSGAAVGPTSPFHRYGAKALIQATHQVLLVQEQHADGSVFWTLPGGGVHANESRCEALRRELSEELRCDSVVAQQCAAFLHIHRSRRESVSTYAVFRTWLLTKPVPNHREGIAQYRWANPATPPAKTLPGVVTVLNNIGET
jgi:ADP-ribose pyrophosphatase YjhB (NUDIX family)